MRRQLTAWAFADQLGSIAGWGTYSGSSWAMQYQAFDAFGNLDADLSSTATPVGGQDLPTIWAGHQLDAATGLYHMQARWYDPRTGQLLSLDPISFAAGDSNLYRYVGNDPVNLVDATGLSPNQANATSADEFIRYVKDLEDRTGFSPQQTLEFIQNKMAWGFVEQFPFANELGLIDDKPDRNLPWTYIYTEKAGWVDMGHFLTNARLAARNPQNTSLIEGLASAYEQFSVVVGVFDPNRPGFGSSANTPEDSVSNRLGIQFGVGFDNQVPLSNQLQSLFESLEAVNSPSKAWNFEYLPKTEEAWEATWRNSPELSQLWLGIILDKQHPYWTVFPKGSDAFRRRLADGNLWNEISSSVPQDWDKKLEHLILRANNINDIRELMSHESPTWRTNSPHGVISREELLFGKRQSP